MAVYYFDPDGGNNANDGLTFATRKKHWNGFSPGNNDELRIMAARAPHSLGSVTWTNGSNNLTLATAKNVTIDNGEAAWTAATNVVTSVTSTGALSRMWRQGTGVARAAVAAAFTTGIIAYKALGATLDLSAYKALSMRIGHNAALADGVLRLDLCSDTAGAVPVASFLLPTSIGGSTNAGYNMYVEQVGALPSNVNSIALYAVTDPGTVNIEIDNLIACRELGHADHLCHDSMIGKETAGEPEMWPIRSIDGTTVVIGSPEIVGSTTTRAYSGATETVTTYAQQTQGVPVTGSLGGGNSGWFITGGWDRVGMTAQTGETFLAGHGSVGIGFTRAFGVDYSVSKVSYTGFVSAIVGSSSGGVVHVQGKHASGNLIVGNATYFGDFSIDYMVFNPTFGDTGGINPYNQKWSIKSKLWGECNQINRGFWTPTAVIPWGTLRHTDLTLGKVRNCVVGFGGLQSATSVVKLRDTVFVGNGKDVADDAYSCQTVLNNCTFARTITIGNISDGSMTYTSRNGDPRINGFVDYMMCCEVQTTTVPATGDTAAWAFGAQAALPTTATVWPKYPVARLAGKAGKTYTIGFDIRRNQSLVQGRVSVTQPDGTVTYTDMTAAANTWETKTLVFTASQDGIADIELGSAGNNVSGRYIYFANLTVAVS